MEKQYKCPHCSSHLKVGDNIILVAKNSSNQKGIVLLHAEVGNYSSLKHPEFVVNDKETIEFPYVR
jgi:hypothetical protein